VKLLRATVNNFGSYKELTFNYEDLGLSLIHGQTGSGKSTLQDIATWIAFGVTAKDGNADEVRSWTSPDEPTTGALILEVHNILITIHRMRGKASQNDLYWLIGDSDEKHRGKDLSESQRLLEDVLGVSKDLYIAGAYYNEFSPTGAFFTAKAKDRRELFEKLADLSLPITLAERTSDVRKSKKKELDSATRQLERNKDRCASTKQTLERQIRDSDTWNVRTTREIDLLRVKIQNFETEKEEKIQKTTEKVRKFGESRLRNIEQLKDAAYRLEQVIKANPHPQCPTCFQVNSKVTKDICRLEEIERDIQRTETQANPYLTDLNHALVFENPHTAQLQALESQANPFDAQIETIGTEIRESEQKVSQLTSQCSELGQNISDLTQLNDLSFELRKVLLTRAVKEIEVATNGYLEKYFESELRVAFELVDSDNLEIQITKNGYPGVYRQMSKGQRQLLNLAFSVSIMKAAANRAGVHFNALFFDEALDGLDAELKVKAFSLFQELSLSHDSILVVEHSTEFKQQFEKSFLVTMENDQSTIEEL